MAAHRYWALLVTYRSSGGTSAAIAELEMRATAGGADQCTGGTPSGLSHASYPAANAFDNSGSTLWFYGAAVYPGTRLAYEFAAPVTVTEMHVTLPGAAAPYPGGTYGPGAVWVQWSDDGTTWRYGSGEIDLSSLGDGGTLAFAVSDQQPTGRLVSGRARYVGLSSPSAGRLVGGSVLKHHPLYDGPYRIAGTTAIDGTPITLVSRRVRLFDHLTGQLVREVWSAPGTGAFEFNGLAARKYLVVTQDHTLLYDPVARAEVVPA